MFIALFVLGVIALMLPATALLVGGSFGYRNLWYIPVPAHVVAGAEEQEFVKRASMRRYLKMIAIGFGICLTLGMAKALAG